MQTCSRQVVVTNPQGLHARPADLLVRCAKRFNAEIALVKDGTRVDGKSILDILMLGADENSTLVIHAQGPDAESAVAALAQLFDQGLEAEEDSNTANSHIAGENLP